MIKQGSECKHDLLFPPYPLISKLSTYDMPWTTNLRGALVSIPLYLVINNIYYCTYLYALRQPNQKNQHREDITTTKFLLPKQKIMFPTGQWLLGEASKYQMVSHDQETNVISASSSYSQDISNEVLYTEEMVK